MSMPCTVAGSFEGVTAARSHRLVLWDIDHTLVDLAGLGADWYAAAFAATIGRPISALPVFHGRTERAITTDLLIANGIEPTEVTVQAIWAELIAQSAASVARLPLEGRALAGAAAALSALAARGSVVQSLVTGNLPEIARHKLAAFDLHHHLDLEVGGYGTLSAHRPDLVPCAMSAAAAKHGVAFAPEAVVVVGDTPNDVEAALAHGATAVAVATGAFSACSLREAGAHTVLTSLADTEAVVGALVGGRV
jgi:phosphoglycolate phosphatase-like HAD superfamily hydrolase